MEHYNRKNGTLSPDLMKTDWVVTKIEDSIRVKQLLLQSTELLTRICRVAEVMAAAIGNGKKVFWFGNGGSAADAQHIVAELVGRFYKERRGLPAEALTTNTSVLTAISNDYDFSQVFARQLEANASLGCIAVGLSTSGNSKNVLCGLDTAKTMGLYTVILTGCKGRNHDGLVDECIRIPSDDTPRIQECHLMVGHILCEMIENTLFPAHKAE